MAKTAPKIKPGMVLPNNSTDNSSNSASLKMATIGPKITALGDMVFNKAQIIPARQNKPLSSHLYMAEMRIIMPMAVKIFPLNGTRKLCKKLPSTISDEAQIVPNTEAFIHFSLMWAGTFI